MILLVLAILCLTICTCGIFYLVKKRVVWHYRGVLFIGISALYFSAVFYVASLLQKGFE